MLSFAPFFLVLLLSKHLVSAAPAFENGNLARGDANGPYGWIAGAWDYGRKPVFEWNSTFGTNGSGGIMIQNDVPNDSHWAQTVSGLTPGTEYRVTAMIRLDSYSWVEDQGWEVGATLSRLDSYDISEPPMNQASPGTWEPVELIFTAESVSETIGCRLGHWSSIVSGIMFCDDFKISTASTSAHGDNSNNSTYSDGDDNEEESTTDYTTELSAGSIALLIVVIALCIFCKPFRNCMCAVCEAAMAGDDDPIVHTRRGPMKKSEARRLGLY